MAKSKSQNKRQTRDNAKSVTPSNSGSNSKPQPQTRSRSQLQASLTSPTPSLKERLQQTINEANNLENPLASIPSSFLKIHLKNKNCAINNAGYNGAIDNTDTIRIIYLKPPLPSNILNQCLQLFQINMAEMYRASSWGLDMEEKKKEFSHSKARFLVALSYGESSGSDKLMTATTRPEITAQEKCNGDVDLRAANLVGFIHYRHEFDNEDDEEEEVEYGNIPPLPPTVCQTYLYELQITPTLQKCGLGHRLMTVLELSSLQSKMSKVVLTVFKTNEPAMKFYLKKLKGYAIDEMSPSNFANGEECDYEILSKYLAKNRI
ncbi:hypothetical protein ACHAXS_002631 [Conticribra weissflogii]